MCADIHYGQEHQSSTHGPDTEVQDQSLHRSHRACNTRPVHTEGSGMPFRVCVPKSSNLIPEPVTRSLTVRETRTSQRYRCWPRARRCAPGCRTPTFSSASRLNTFGSHQATVWPPTRGLWRPGRTHPPLEASPEDSGRQRSPRRSGAPLGRVRAGLSRRQQGRAQD